MYTERLLLAHIRILGVGFSSIHLCTRYGYTQRREGIQLLSRILFFEYLYLLYLKNNHESKQQRG
jgi:hypothetical protein